jgi:hypothetical protein
MYIWINMRNQQWQTIVSRLVITPSTVATEYMDRLVKEATEVGSQKTLTGTVAWYPVTNVLRRKIMQSEHLTPPTVPHGLATNCDPRVPADT